MLLIEGITAAKSSIELAKKITDLLDRPHIDVPDVRAKLHEMLIHAVNALVALGEAQTEINELKHQLDDREELRAIRADLEFVQDGSYYLRSSEKDQNPVPYCAACWGDQQKLVPLSQKNIGVFHCAIHDTTNVTRAYEEEINRKKKQGELRPSRPTSSFLG